MGRNKKVFQDFIDKIPDDKLKGFPNSQKTLCKDTDLRLDMQMRKFLPLILYAHAYPCLRSRAMTSETNPSEQ